MTRILYGLGRVCVRFRWLVLLVWLAALVGIGGLAQQLGDATNDNYSLPGTGSQQASDVLNRLFPEQENGTSPIVLHARNGGSMAEGGELEQTLRSAYEALKDSDQVQDVVNPLSQAGEVLHLISDDGSTAYIPIILDEPIGDVTIPEAERILETAREAVEGSDLEVAVGGVVGAVLSQPDPGDADRYGLIAAMIILAVVFGSLVAMGIPIVTALFALGIGLAGITVLSNSVDIPTVAPTLATMIGLGVGIDYALFTVTRHRDHLREGMEMRESIARATATSGGAIVFAGSTVMIAIASLGLAGIPLVSSMGYATSLVVFVAVMAAITLLPAILAIIGRHIDSLRMPKFLRARHVNPAEGVWAKWADWVGRHPWIAVGVALGILVPLTVPLFSLELGSPDVEAQPVDNTARIAYKLLDHGFGPGYNGQLLIAVELDEPASPSQAYLDDEQALRDGLRAWGRDLKDGLKERGSSLKADGERLAAQGAPLLADKERLEREGAALLRQKEILERKGAALLRQKVILERKGAALQAAGERTGARLAAVAAKIQVVQAKLAGTSDPVRQAHLQARLQRLGARAQALQAKLAKIQSAGARLEAQGARLAKEGAALQAAGERLAADGARLQSEGQRLAKRGAPLQRKQKVLEQRGAELRREAKRAKALGRRVKHGHMPTERFQELKDAVVDRIKQAGGKKDGTDARLLALQEAFRSTPGVVDVSPVQVSDNRRAAVITVTPQWSPSNEKTTELVAGLRDDVIPRAVGTNGTKAFVGGITAAYDDLAEKIGEKLPWVIATVIALSFLLLMIAFRSIAIPIKAAIMNILSVTAAYGILVAIFQWGWGLELIGVTQAHTVPIVSFVPLMMFAVLFGLSMDYEVFLMSQIAEHHATGETNHDSVVHGLATSARVITAAALIMVAVFGSFILNEDPIIKQFGIGLSVAVALDATIIRVLLVPASMTLLGDANWWLPRWLAKVLPRLDLEGKAYFMDKDDASKAMDLAAAERDLPVPE